MVVMSTKLVIERGPHIVTIDRLQQFLGSLNWFEGTFSRIHQIGCRCVLKQNQ